MQISNNELNEKVIELKAAVHSKDNGMKDSILQLEHEIEQQNELLDIQKHEVCHFTYFCKKNEKI